MKKLIFPAIVCVFLAVTSCSNNSDSKDQNDSKAAKEKVEVKSDNSKDNSTSISVHKNGVDVKTSSGDKVNVDKNGADITIKKDSTN